MNWTKAIWTRFLDLFIDDGNLVVAVLVWLAVCWLIMPRLGLLSVWPPVLLFVGLILILAESTVRCTRRRP